MLKEGVLIDLSLFLILLAAYLYFYQLASQGKKLPSIRAIPALDAIVEGIGRAAEMGRPVHYCPGHIGQISGEHGPAILASLNIYRYTVEECARREVPIYISLPNNPEIIPLVDALTEDAYRSADKLELYDPSKLLFYASEAHIAAIIGTILRYNVALNVIVGACHTEVSSHAAAARIGAMNIGGTTRFGALYGQAVSCDYLFISEDIYAAGARCSGDPFMTISIFAQEIEKFVLIAMSIVLLISSLIGSEAIFNLLAK